MDNATAPSDVRRRDGPNLRHPHKRLSVALGRLAPPGTHCDNSGLFLYVRKTRSWIHRFVFRDRQLKLGLRNLAPVSLPETREQALANPRTGGHPPAAKRLSGGVTTFAEAVRRVVERERVAWRSSQHTRNRFRSLLESHAWSRIGKAPVSAVNERSRAGDSERPGTQRGATEHTQHLRIGLEGAIPIDCGRTSRATTASNTMSSST